MNTRELQTALNSLGYDAGAVDGVMGRQTIKALKGFQAAAAIEIDGAFGPQSLKALEAALKAKGIKVPAATTKTIELPWMSLLMTKKGLHETRNNTDLKKFLKSDGKTLGDPSKLPWCGDLVETVLALTLPKEKLPVNPYLAVNWAKFGQQVDPVYGAIGSFWRESKNSGLGHVCFIVGESGNYFICAGGNQNDMITDTAKVLKSKLLSARWPLTFPLVKEKLITKSGVAATQA